MSKSEKPSQETGLFTDSQEEDIICIELAKYDKRVSGDYGTFTNKKGSDSVFVKEANNIDRYDSKFENRREYGVKSPNHELSEDAMAEMEVDECIRLAHDRMMLIGWSKQQVVDTYEERVDEGTSLEQRFNQDGEEGQREKTDGIKTSLDTTENENDGTSSEQMCNHTAASNLPSIDSRAAHTQHEPENQDGYLSSHDTMDDICSKSGESENEFKNSTISDIDNESEDKLNSLQSELEKMKLELEDRENALQCIWSIYSGNLVSDIYEGTDFTVREVVKETCYLQHELDDLVEAIRITNVPKPEIPDVFQFVDAYESEGNGYCDGHEEIIQPHVYYPLYGEKKIPKHSSESLENKLTIIRSDWERLVYETTVLNKKLNDTNDRVALLSSRVFKLSCENSSLKLQLIRQNMRDVDVSEPNLDLFPHQLDHATSQLDDEVSNSEADKCTTDCDSNSEEVTTTTTTATSEMNSISIEFEDMEVNENKLLPNSELKAEAVEKDDTKLKISDEN